MVKKKNDNMLTKVIRLKVVKLISPTEDWKECGKIIRGLQEEVRKASNSIITTCNMYYSEKRLYGQSQADETITNLYNTNLRSHLYHIATANCKSLYSKNANSISEEIYSKYFGKKSTTYESMMENGEGNPPMGFSKDMALPITGQGITIEKTDKGYYNLSVPLFNNSFKKSWNEDHDEKMKDGKFVFGVQVNNSQKEIVERCMNGEYKIGGSKLLYVKDKKGKSDLCLNLTFSFPVEKKSNLDINKVCGIDLGIAKPATAAVSYNKYSRLYINDTSIIDHKTKLNSERKRLQRNITYGALGDSGHGTKTKVNKLTTSRDRVSNFVDTKNYQWAKELVEWAVKMDCGKIRMEDLSGFNKRYAKDNFLKQWTYFDLQLKIENKAKEYGIIIEKINPKYTSQTCSLCGFVSSENRPKGEKGQSYFKCCACENEENADFNAAKNIASGMLTR